MSKNICTKLLLLLFFTTFSLTISAQALKNGETFWNWKSRADKDKFQLNFDLSLKIKGKNVSGAFVFGNLVNGEWDDSDRNVTPFIGKIVGKNILIEFDPNDAGNFEEYDSPFDVKYRKPKAKSASRAVIKITKNSLQFTMTTGKVVFDLPRKIVMRRKF